MAIVILAGPIGAGKTTVGRELLASAPDGTAYIEGDTFWRFIPKPLPDQDRRKAFFMTMRAMLAAAWHYYRDGYEVIVDFSVPPGFVDAAKKLLRGEPFHYVVLRPSEDVCARRAAERPEGTITDYREYSDFYQTFACEERFLICDDESSPRELAERIRAGIERGTFVV